MAVTLAETLRDAISDAVDALIGSSATLELQDSGGTEIATISLSNPAFGASSSGVITLSGVPLSDTNATGGTMAKFQFKSGGTTAQISGSVGASGEDINFPGGLAIGAGDTITIGALTITAPGAGGGGSGSTINAASASEANVQSAIDSASAGDTVVVPSGTGTWSTLSIAKAIKLVGAGIGSTTITLGAGNTITKQSGGYTRIQGFSFTKTGGGNSSHPFTVDGSWLSAEPVIIEDCRFDISGSGLFNVDVAGGVIWAKCAFYGEWDDSFIRPKATGDTESWTTDSTMGDDDTNGKKNLYVEDCYFYGGTNQGMDFDDAARAVMRYTLLDYCSFNSHGLATSAVGVRHWEVYENTFRNSSVPGGTDTDAIANQNWGIWIRGGTGVIYNNVIDNIANSYWGTGKDQARFDVRACQDGSGSTYGHYNGSASNAGGPGNLGAAKYSAGYGLYPRERQCGQGWDEGLTNAVGLNGGSGDYFTDPIYCWANTGAGCTGGVINDFSTAGNWGSQSGYFTASTDYYNTASTAKPGYTAYTYPHPLRETTGQAY